jgi:hypothetical protein
VRDRFSTAVRGQVDERPGVGQLNFDVMFMILHCVCDKLVYFSWKLLHGLFFSHPRVKKHKGAH